MKQTRLSKILSEKLIKVSALARKIEVDKARLFRIVWGDYPPSLDEARKISGFLQQPLDDVFPPRRNGHAGS